MAMTIDELKKALVEVSELCWETCYCSKCPLHYEEVEGVPECPLCDETLTIPPAYWAKNRLMKEDAE